VGQLEELARQFGPRFEPGVALRRLAAGDTEKPAPVGTSGV
jgi:hypothetical protein